MIKDNMMQNYSLLDNNENLLNLPSKKLEEKPTKTYEIDGGITVIEEIKPGFDIHRRIGEGKNLIKNIAYHKLSAARNIIEGNGSSFFTYDEDNNILYKGLDLSKLTKKDRADFDLISDIYNDVKSVNDNKSYAIIFRSNGVHVNYKSRDIVHKFEIDSLLKSKAPEEIDHKDYIMNSIEDLESEEIDVLPTTNNEDSSDNIDYEDILKPEIADTVV